MTNYLKSFSMLSILLLTILFLPSCKDEEGCTDPNAENFSSDADEDDGSCVLAREKFLGMYNAVEDCDSFIDEYTMQILSSETGTGDIIIQNLYGDELDIAGFVSGDSFTFEQTFTDPEYADEVLYSGTGTFVSENRVDIDFTLSGDYYGTPLTVACTAVLTK